MSNSVDELDVAFFITMLPILILFGVLLNFIGRREGEAYGRQEQEILTIKYCITKPKECKLKYDFYNLK
jgi:3-dehydroquinate dehydratase